MEYICLQKEIRDLDKDLLDQHPEIRYFSHDLDDFTDTAALCALMDVVISVDTSVAHLAGTLGKPTWVLLPFCPDWRWMLGKNKSPWYQSMSLYRQPAIGDWEGVLKKVKTDIFDLKP
jgi:ADP-heptose:LPS heptosyltransferase